MGLTPSPHSTEPKPEEHRSPGKSYLAQDITYPWTSSSSLSFLRLVSITWCCLSRIRDLSCNRVLHRQTGLILTLTNHVEKTSANLFHFPDLPCIFFYSSKFSYILITANFCIKLRCRAVPIICLLGCNKKQGPSNYQVANEILMPAVSLMFRNDFDAWV